MQKIICTLLCGVLPLILPAQSIPLNHYGLPVVGTTSLYRQLAAVDSSRRLVDIQQFIPGIHLKIYYATKHNFTHRKLYREAKAFLRLPAARALRGVEEELKPQGLGLQVFDAYRPYAVTEKMWRVVPDDRYAADPRHGSGHNRGTTVDVTLISLKTGKALAMPTGFDNFTSKAHRDYMALPDSVIANRQKLEKMMVKHGFVPLPTEWWHFSLKGSDRYPLMNISFEDLQKAL